MHISASVKNSFNKHDVTVSTNNIQKQIDIPAKTEGFGSSINGGELLFLSLATCFCNDIYREAARRNISIQSIEVNVTGEFGKEGEPASNIIYDVNIQSKNANEEIQELINDVDKIAEVHNTLRKGMNVTLKKILL
jgi:uncharacterized OsmC-like protein